MGTIAEVAEVEVVVEIEEEEEAGMAMDEDLLEGDVAEMIIVEAADEVEIVGVAVSFSPVLPAILYNSVVHHSFVL